MDRRAWLEDRRAAVTADYDDEAATYDEHPYPNEMQRAFIDRLLETCPVGGIVLDAPCGTGQYFAQVAASGRRVVGIDQSAGMLAQSGARGIADALYLVGLQELAFEREFDGVMTVDAMENVFPEDWPLVLSNLRRAVRPGGHLYLTVEEVDEAAIAAAFAEGTERGLPVVRGEVVEGDTAGYHYYPGRAQVHAWLAGDGLTVVAEDTSDHGDWGYWHLLLRAP